MDATYHDLPVDGPGDSQYVVCTVLGRPQVKSKAERLRVCWLCKCYFAARCKLQELRVHVAVGAPVPLLPEALLVQLDRLSLSSVASQSTCPHAPHAHRSDHIVQY